MKMNIEINSITPIQLKEQLDAMADIILFDVREEWEHILFNIGGFNIPMAEIMSRVNEIPTNKPVVLYCEKGIRSMIVLQRLHSNFPNLINLAGGITAWKRTFESK